ncbi:MAG: aminotransferase class III-fold pyridoxal phosphate-dependent enzyme [Actinomycetota bacterium]|nr:aminotransferase class III-fold pyridoxal phosphate-dependent enzyme [Actinomycetota bacterium]
MSAHDELLRRHRAVLPGWVALYYDEPISLVDGEGRHVVDADGRRYLDFFGGILTTSVGYNLPEIVEPVRAQAGRMVHTSTLYLIEQQIELAERIAARSNIPDAKVFLTSSGTEANEAALLFTTNLRRSNQVLAMRNSFHGRSFGAMAITGNAGWSASGLSPVQVSYLRGAYRYRSPLRDLADDAYIAAHVDDLRELLATTTSGDVACLIAEPIQGVGGFALPPDGFYGAIAEVLAEHGILFVSDEVQTGWGRTGAHEWGIGAHGVVPDAMTFAKGLANGLPIGGIVGRAELIDAVPANSISTFGGNPLAATAALATLDYLDTHDVRANVAREGERLMTALGEATSLPFVGDLRGRGLMVGVELVHPGTGEPDAAAAAAVLDACRAEGLLVGKGGLAGNVLRIAPPMTVTAAEIDHGAGILLDALSAVGRPHDLAGV